MKNILIVDDEPNIIESIKINIEDSYNVYGASSFDQAFDVLLKIDIELIVLDINIPQTSGFEICTEIRSLENYQDLPIVFLSGQINMANQIISYKLGGDHFIEKPVNFKLLIAIVDRLIQKRGEGKKLLTFQNMVLDEAKRELVIDQVPVKLKQKEFLILAVLVKNVDSVVSREMFLKMVWKEDMDISDRVVDAHISNLRKKISNANCLISGVYQEGYKLASKQ